MLLGYDGDGNPVWEEYDTATFGVGADQYGFQAPDQFGIQSYIPALKDNGSVDTFGDSRRMFGGKEYTTNIGNVHPSQVITLPNGEKATLFSNANKYYNQKDLFSYGPMVAMGLVGGLGAGAFDSALGIGSAELGGSIGSQAAGGLGSDTFGGNMGFFDDFFGDFFTDSLAPDAFSQSLVDNPFTMYDLGGAPWAPATATAPFQPGFNLFDPSTYSGSFPGTSFFDNLRLPNIPGGDAVSRFLFGSNAQGGSRGIADIFGDRGLIGTGLALGPGIAAINYARNQEPFDTGRLESVYDSIDPNSLALPYDLQTAKGRTNLTSSLTDRGVMGSSFANQDLSSYDTLRDLGRSNLLTSGAGTQATVANMILQAQAKERELKNNLYGRALLALSGGMRSTDIIGP